MRITIGIYTKNSEKTIGDTIHSILAQDFFKYHSMENVEIIVVDANSRDKTIEVIKTVYLKPQLNWSCFLMKEKDWPQQDR